MTWKSSSCLTSLVYVITHAVLLLGLCPLAAALAAAAAVPTIKMSTSSSDSSSQKQLGTASSLLSTSSGSFDASFEIPKPQTPTSMLLKMGVKSPHRSRSPSRSPSLSAAVFHSPYSRDREPTSPGRKKQRVDQDVVSLQLETSVAIMAANESSSAPSPRKNTRPMYNYSDEDQEVCLF